MAKLSFVTKYIFVLLLFHLLSFSVYAKALSNKLKVVSTSLASDEIIFSLLERSSRKESFDIYYSYIAYNQDYSNISDLIPKEKIFHINKESLFIKDPDIIFLSPYNKAEFLDSVSSYSHAKAYIISPSSTLDELLSNITLIGEALDLTGEATFITRHILTSLESVKSRLSLKQISVLTYMPHNITISSYTLLDDLLSRLGIHSISKDSIGYASLDEEKVFLGDKPDYIIFINANYSDQIIDFELENSYLKRIKISKDKLIYISEKLAFCTSNFIVDLIEIFGSL